jgi:iron complex transport system substrate-binding protein
MRLYWLAVLIALGMGCSAPRIEPPTTPRPPIVGEARSPREARIVEPRVAPGVFPRTVHDGSGDVVIPRKPLRIHTLSVGLDEITFQLVDPSRVVAVGSVTANPEYSNIADLAAQIPLKVGRDAEQILAAAPDLVVASPFADQNLVRQLRDANVPVVVADLVSSADGQADNVRFLAYLYGEEARGEAVAQDVEARINRLRAVSSQRPRDRWLKALVLSSGHPLSAAGSGTTEDGVLELAGLRNAAAEAGVVGNRDISIEALSETQPDVVIVTEANPSQPTLVPTLEALPVIGDLPAFQADRVKVIKASLLTTLSQWNVAGAEQLNRAMYPGELNNLIDR